MIKVLIRNNFTYISEEFNDLPQPVKNKIIRQLSYDKKVSQHNKIQISLFQRTKSPDPSSRYIIPTGLLLKMYRLFKSLDVQASIKDRREAQPSIRPLKGFFKRLNKVAPEIEQRDYQIDAIEKCLKYKRGLVNQATGSGKTLVLSGLLYCLNTKSLVLCTGKEHVRQISKDIETLVGYETSVFGSGKSDTSGAIVIANVQALNAIKKKNLNKYKKLLKKFKCIIADECFIPGTLISTPNGKIPIEKVKTGDLVYSFNEKTYQIEEKEVTHVFKNKTNKLIKIKSAAGEIYCTPNHPIYTQRGWVEAKNILKSLDITYIAKDKDKGIELHLTEDTEILEQGDNGRFESLCPENTVFNLEVADNNTYVANNLIVHNCHHCGSDSYKSVIYHCSNAYWRFGFSGTMHREDGAFLEVIGAIGPILDKKDYSYLEDNNHIVPARFYFIDPMCDILRGRANYWPTCLQYGIVENNKRNNFIARICRSYERKNKKVLVITPFRVSHGAILNEIIPNSKFIYGNSSESEREDGLRAFKEGEFNTLISSTIYDEIINLPDVRCVILAGGGKAHNSFFQRVGRGIRKSPGKSHIDIIVLWDSHSSVLLKHSVKIKSYAKKIDKWAENIKMVGQYRAQYNG